ncbi:hypothetical protein BDN70DRAFT_934329 [Pholiota conissans]|uniref:Uncharacterized protein n=1 Tax=Pholiota conissans TaxID=109636 RepID=A0A9P5YX37_9AGAR|nr:hypothetical protein BDN70DRAFT_934329 [Pholiota conissans]
MESIRSHINIEVLAIEKALQEIGARRRQLEAIKAKRDSPDESEDVQSLRFLKPKQLERLEELHRAWIAGSEEALVKEFELRNYAMELLLENDQKKHEEEKLQWNEIDEEFKQLRARIKKLKEMALEMQQHPEYVAREKLKSKISRQWEDAGYSNNRTERMKIIEEWVLGQYGGPVIS